jgi:hypothetical protein
VSRGEHRAAAGIPQLGKIMAEVIILPGKRHDRFVGEQLLKPSSNRSNVVELWRVRLDRAFERLNQVLSVDYRRAGD